MVYLQLIREQICCESFCMDLKPIVPGGYLQLWHCSQRIDYIYGEALEGYPLTSGQVTHSGFCPSFIFKQLWHCNGQQTFSSVQIGKKKKKRKVSDDKFKIKNDVLRIKYRFIMCSSN